MMKRTTSTLALVAAAALLATSCSSSTTASPTVTTVAATTITVPAPLAAPTTVAPTTAPTSTTTTEAPTPSVDPALFGPYQVGRTTITLIDDARGGRALPVDIWYPVDQGVVADPSEYVFAGEIKYTSANAMESPKISADGPFPLVVYSHGFDGIRWVSAFLTERLASQGFIVVAADHVGNTFIDAFLGREDEPDTLMENRLSDIEFLLSSVLNGTGSPVLASTVATIDSNNIGIVGHSLGGWTALNVVAGGDNRPADTRFKAAVGLAAFTSPISDDTLRAVNVPTLLIGGTLDKTTPIDTDLQRPSEMISGRPFYRIDIEGAGHQTFSDVCLYQQLLPTVTAIPQSVIDAIDDFASGACTPEYIDYVQGQRIIDTYAIGFFIDQLTDRTDAAPIFTTDYAARFPAVTFTAKN